MARSTNDTRVCLYCSSEFTPNSGKQVYCNDKCRGAAHEAKKKEKVEELEGTLQERSDELEALKTAPKSRKEVVQEVNPDWQRCFQKVDAQRKKCYEIEADLTECVRKALKLTNIDLEIRMGVICGIMAASIPIALSVDSKKGRPLDMTFYVFSIACLLAGILIGSFLGKVAGNHRLANDPELASKLAVNDTEQDELEDRLVVEKQVLKALEEELNDLPKFTTNRVTFVDEASEPSL